MTTTTNDECPPNANSIREARQLLGGIAQPTIYSLINSKKIRTFKIGRRRFITDEAIRDFFDRAEVETAAAAEDPGS